MFLIIWGTIKIIKFKALHWENNVEIWLAMKALIDYIASDALKMT